MKRRSVIAQWRALLLWRQRWHSWRSVIGVGWMQVGGRLSQYYAWSCCQVFQAGVRDPHAGEYMCHVAEIALKGVFSYGRASCLQGSQSNLLWKYLEVWYWVWNTGEIRGEGDPRAEFKPLQPGDVASMGAGRVDPALLGPPSSAVVIICATSGVGRKSR